MRMTLYDVAIVGAGPGGSALATYLAREGLRVLLLEKEVFPRDKVCGDFVSPRAFRCLAALGCWNELTRRDYVPIKGSSLYLNGQRLSRGDLPSVDGMADYGYAIPRKELDEVIFRNAVRAGAEAVEGCRVTAFAVESQSVRLTAQVGGRATTFTSRVIVGADGAQSVVAKQLGLQMQDPRYVLASMRAYCEGLRLDDAVLAFEDDFFPGFAWIFPVRDGLANVGVGMMAELKTKFGLNVRRQFAHLERFIQRLAAERGCRVRIDTPVGWPIKSYGGASRTVFDRGLLVGEAGCVTDPISGAGIPEALETAEMAANTLCAAFAAGRFDATALAPYEHSWQTRYEADLSVSDLVTSMVRNRHLRDVWLLALRVTAKASVTDPTVARTLGGLFAGLIPARQALAPDMLLQLVVHDRAFWEDVLQLPASPSLLDLAERALGLAQWQWDTLWRVAADRDWFLSWLLEVQRKQMTTSRATAREPLLRLVD
jgi:geranylgeranyl reductase family protein